MRLKGNPAISLSHETWAERFAGRRSFYLKQTVIIRYLLFLNQALLFLLLLVASNVESTGLQFGFMIIIDFS